VPPQLSLASLHSERFKAQIELINYQYKIYFFLSLEWSM